MSTIIVVIAALLIVYGFLMSQPAALFFGFVAFLAGALLHMRKRRNEQLDAMRGRGKNE